MLPVLANGAAFVITSSRPPYGSPALGMIDAVTDDGRRVMEKCDWRRMCVGCQHREKVLENEVECNHLGTKPLEFRYASLVHRSHCQ